MGRSGARRAPRLQSQRCAKAIIMYWRQRRRLACMKHFPAWRTICASGCLPSGTDCASGCLLQEIALTHFSPRVFSRPSYRKLAQLKFLPNCDSGLLGRGHQHLMNRCLLPTFRAPAWGADLVGGGAQTARLFQQTRQRLLLAPSLSLFSSVSFPPISRPPIESSQTLRSTFRPSFRPANRPTLCASGPTAAALPATPPAALPATLPATTGPRATTTDFSDWAATTTDFSDSTDAQNPCRQRLASYCPQRLAFPGLHFPVHQIFLGAPVLRATSTTTLGTPGQWHASPTRGTAMATTPPMHYGSRLFWSGCDKQQWWKCPCRDQ